MKYQTAFHKIISRDKGIFSGGNFIISTDSINWVQSYSLWISEQGQLYSSDESENHYLLLQSLQSCYVQIYPSFLNSNPQQQPTKRRLSKKSSTTSINNIANNSEEPPVIYVKTYENEKLYIKVPSKTNFINLVSSLIVWQSLKPQGLVKKWYCENKVGKSTIASEPHELLVCRFKIYGPIPPKSKNLNIVPGPKAPVYQQKIDSQNDLNNLNLNSNSHHTTTGSQNDNVNEGWFYAMGVLKSNGILNFITELDGTLLYSIDIKSIMSSEIREVHHSIFDNSNILFIGQIKELRFNNVIKSVNSLNHDQYTTLFLTREGKVVPNNQRILIEFPLHIDLEDWFVGLNYFAKREYIGSFSPSSKLLVSNSDSITLNDFNKENFRVSKKLSIDIIEAKFDNMSKESQGKIYAEVVMWGLPWSRTAIVNHTNNPFWKEGFSTDLPISTQMIHILIKKCSFNDSSYSSGDKLIGTVYITPDILTKQLNTASTMTTGSDSGNLINVRGSATNIISNGNISSINNDIVRLSIYDSLNLPIGKLLLNVNLKEYHILSPYNYKSLEKMLISAPMKDLIKFCNENVPSSDFENVSLIMLDIFQSLNVEDQWFKTLMEDELVNVDKMTRKNYVSKKRNSDQPQVNSSSSNNVFNTLFRGSSIFSKSLEKYNLRIGQEYLEKVFSDFFEKISTEKKNCEVDPRYVRLQEKAERKGKTIDDSDLDSDLDDSDDEYDSDVERERNEKIEEIVDENFKNLYNYAEEIWRKIYITSNDLPQQIKTQLKNFRTKVELACDPEDKVTPLNCLSAFIFLRFFCPAILNPKLFYLTKNHQKGTTQRTFTLIAKILLNLGNRQEFSPHKEPHLVKMNKFLNEHQSEVFDYFDKITGRKNDFNPKILDLSHEVKRFDLGLNGDSNSNELLTTPYLIDKYLRLTELIHLLNYNNKSNRGSSISTNHLSPTNGGLVTSNSSIITTNSNNNTNANTINHYRDSFHESNGDIRIDDEKNVYQIGSLEFEMSEFLDLASDNETEGFIKSLCKSDENIFSFITSNITLKDLQKQSFTLMTKIHYLEYFLEDFEFPSSYKDQQLWDAFTNNILSKCYLDTTRNSLVYLDKDLVVPHTYKRVTDNALASLKLKFSSDQSNDSVVNGNNTNNNHKYNTMPSSFSSGSLGSVIKSGTKNPFKKWLRKS